VNAVRRIATWVLVVLAGLLFLITVVAGWARNTVYDSGTFSKRAVELLNSNAVRRELASRLTEQLIRSGNQQAISFRPAYQLAIEAAIDTDTFRSIFRTAIRRTHEAILAGQNGSAGLDLADSVAVISSTLQLPGNAAPSDTPKAGLNNSLTDVTERLGRLGVWKLDDIIITIGSLAFIGTIVAAAGAIAVSTDRRRAVRRLGWAVVIDGILILVALQVLQWWVGRGISDSSLGEAIDGAVAHATDDLRISGLWLAGYGVVIAAAASASGRSYTPMEVGRRVRGWVERRRASTWGTVLIGVAAILIGIVFVQEPLGNLELLIIAGGLWLSYLGVCELLRVVRAAAAPAGRRWRWRRTLAVGLTVVVLAALLTAGLVISTRGAANRAEAVGEVRCNGEAALCDLPLDKAIFPGTHNSMSSSLYPGWLFGEQIDTIKGQLDAGVRALLIDTHYGVPSTSRLPGSNTPIVLTDRAAELTTPPGENIDPAVAERASRLAARAPRDADATRDIYLCHNFCELGAVTFSSVLADLKQFVDTHPDDVVLLDIQDATTPADTAAAIQDAGLEDRIATLVPGQPLPTLGDLINARHNLLVFAEEGGPGAPPWYQKTYDWFQETPYSFNTADEFSCRPNRGNPSAPMFLMNHWVTASPPDPEAAGKVNAAAALSQRIEACIAERGLVPTIVAVDFSEKGGLVKTLHKINAASLREARAARERLSGSGPSTTRVTAVIITSPTTVPGAPPTSAAAPPAAPPVAEASLIPSLTGGDPARFCPILPTAVRAILAWAEAVIDESPADAGVTDFAYAPLLDRVLKTYLDSAPEEVAARAKPLAARVRAADAAVTSLGVSQAAQQKLADQAEALLAAPESPDGVTVQARLIASLQQVVPADRLRSAAVVFTANQPDPATVLDLGYVSDQVAATSSFKCPNSVIARI
jgi:hypothetical protein